MKNIFLVVVIGLVACAQPPKEVVGVDDFNRQRWNVDRKSIEKTPLIFKVDSNYVAFGFVDPWFGRKIEKLKCLPYKICDQDCIVIVHDSTNFYQINLNPSCEN